MYFVLLFRLRINMNIVYITLSVAKLIDSYKAEQTGTTTGKLSILFSRAAKTKMQSKCNLTNL